MPRPNLARSVLAEQNVRERVAYERQRWNEGKGLSFEALAKRMDDAGCPIQLSALYRIDKGDPPRRITVDELVAFSSVFKVPVDEFMLPIDAVKSAHATELLKKLGHLMATIRDAGYELRDWLTEYRLAVDEDSSASSSQGEVIATLHSNPNDPPDDDPVIAATLRFIQAIGAADAPAKADPPAPPVVAARSRKAKS